MCRLHGGRAGAPKGEANGAYRNGIWTGDAIALRKSAAKLIRRVAKPIDIEELKAKLERRRHQPADEREPYTGAEVRALLAYAKATLKAKRGTRAERKAANKAAWAAGDRGRWKEVTKAATDSDLAEKS